MIYFQDFIQQLIWLRQERQRHQFYFDFIFGYTITLQAGVALRITG